MVSEELSDIVAEGSNLSATATNDTIEEHDDNDQQEQQQASHVDVPSGSTIVAVGAFQNHRSLQTIHLPIGLQMIFENAFLGCASLQSIEIPSTVHTIRDQAFYESGLVQLDLLEGLQILGNLVFACTPLRLARVPATVLEMGYGTFYRCFRMISIEMPGKSFLPSRTFMHCYSLRNIALKEDSDVGHRGLARCTYLATHFPNEDYRLQALQRRFEGLPVHHLCYYHSYYGSGSKTEWFISKLEEAATTSISDQRSQQDCLGMTPVHILALSTRQSLALYKVLLKNFPADVITKDKWGDLPLHFVCKIDAPLEIIEFLLQESCRVAEEEAMDLGIEGILKDSNNHFAGETARLLLEYHIRKKLLSLALETWREEVLVKLDQVALEDSWSTRDDRISQVLRKMKSFETTESTSLLELAFWKSKMVSSGCWGDEERSNPSIRQQYRIHCGVGIALPNILPFLVAEDDDGSSLEETMMM